MSLQQGPVDLLITSVAHANQMLSVLKTRCEQQAHYHRQVISDFLTHFALDEIRELPERYDNQQLAPLIESANYYNLTVSSSFTIIVHGIESLETHFSGNNHTRLNNLFTLSNHSLNRSLMLLAKTKVQVEKNLTDFSRNHRKIEEPTPIEMRDKAALLRTVDILASDIQTLDEIERLTITYYETVLKAEEIFKELSEFEKSLLSLKKQLSTLTPIKIVPPPSANWEKSFESTDLFKSDNLAALLKSRLSLKTSDPDWDALSLPGSKRSSLLQPIDSSVMNTALLPQFHQQIAAQGASSSTEDEDIFLGEKPPSLTESTQPGS